MYNFLNLELSSRLCAMINNVLSCSQLTPLRHRCNQIFHPAQCSSEALSTSFCAIFCGCVYSIIHESFEWGGDRAEITKGRKAQFCFLVLTPTGYRESNRKGTWQKVQLSDNIGKETSFEMAALYDSYNQTVLLHWQSFVKKVQIGSTDIKINGSSLDLASVIVVAR